MGTVKKLDGVEFVPRWTSFAGALEGCLRYLGDAPTFDYIMGISGHAFRISIHEFCCPSGPTIMDFNVTARLCSGLDYSLEYFNLECAKDTDLIPKRAEAWKKVTASIDAGKPTVMWELDIPEFGVVYGYDPEAETYLAAAVTKPEGGLEVPYKAVPKPDHTGWLACFLIGDNISADKKAAERRAIEFAVDHARGKNPDPIPELYRHGLEAWKYWQNALDNPDLVPMGNAYCAAVYQEARYQAGIFLQEIAAGHGAAGEHLEYAGALYSKVADHLAAFATLFPFPDGGDLNEFGITTEGKKLLAESYKLEEEAVTALEKFITAAARNQA